MKTIHVVGAALLAASFCVAPGTAQLGNFSWAAGEALQAVGIARDNGEEVSYGRGTQLIDNLKYSDALAVFDEIKTGPRAEGSLYWKAYCLNKLGRRDEALAALARLRQEHPNSRWLDDAKVLEAEARQGNGQPAADEANNHELKLMAINGLLAADPDRAVAQLERLLKGNSPPTLKKKALFVLTQNPSPRAHQILSDFAKGNANPDLQMQALRYMGMSGTEESRKQLASIYSSSNDVQVKRTIIRSLMLSHGKEQLLELAKSEKQPELRKEAIRQLGIIHSGEELKQLYGTETDAGVKKVIIDGLFIGNDAKSLVELARKEKDMNLKKEMVSHLALMRSKEATDYMEEILK